MSTSTDPRPGFSINPVTAFFLSTAMASVAATAVAFVLTSTAASPPTACEYSCETPAAAVAPTLEPPAADVETSPTPPAPPTPPAAAQTVPVDSSAWRARIPRVREAKAEVGDGLDHSIIRRFVRAHINEIRYCYNEGLSRDPDLGGRAVVRFTIGATGRVDQAQLETSPLDDATVESCMVEAVERWVFPKPRAGEPVVVSYPFVLSPG